MNSGPTAERVYGALKARVLAGGFAPGARLDPTVLASDFSSSVTPIREALHILTGERLVETRTADGFHVPNITVPDLEDRYALCLDLLLLTLRRSATKRRWQDSNGDMPAGTPADQVAALFVAIANGSSNGEHPALVRAVGDRLHAARIVEADVLTGVDEELAALASAIADPVALRKAIVAYHRRRHRRASAIVRALHRRD